MKIIVLDAKRINASRALGSSSQRVSGQALVSNASFAYVVIYDASQQTEPETLVPLVKGWGESSPRWRPRSIMSYHPAAFQGT